LSFYAAVSVVTSGVCLYRLGSIQLHSIYVTFVNSIDDLMWYSCGKTVQFRWTVASIFATSSVSFSSFYLYFTFLWCCFIFSALLISDGSRHGLTGRLPQHWQKVRAGRGCQKQSASDMGESYPVAVLEKIFGGPGPSSFGRQQWLSEITIEWSGQDLGGMCPTDPNVERHWSYHLNP